MIIQSLKLASRSNPFVILSNLFYFKQYVCKQINHNCTSPSFIPSNYEISISDSLTSSVSRADAPKKGDWVCYFRNVTFLFLKDSSFYVRIEKDPL